MEGWLLLAAYMAYDAIGTTEEYPDMRIARWFLAIGCAWMAAGITNSGYPAILFTAMGVGCLLGSAAVCLLDTVMPTELDIDEE